MTAAVSEDEVEQALLQWLADLSWRPAYEQDISPPAANTLGTDRDNCRDVVPATRRREGISRLSRRSPPGAR